MDDNLKNIVVLKNLPSNIVEEAIVILKQKKLAKNFEYIDKKNEKKLFNAKIKPKDYIVKEAEMVISGYISRIEKQKESKEILNLKNKYKRLKILSTLLGIITFINIISLFLQ